MTKPARSLIVTGNVGKTFGSVHALNGVDFTVHPGRIVAVMGHNGAGKSTLMQIIAGTLARDSGVMEIDGRPVTDAYDVEEAHAHGIRCVFQELSLCPNLTVTENARIVHKSLRGWNWRAKARALIRARLDEIYPGNRVDTERPVGSLPIGQRQMVETARAFTETDRLVRVVILDEPTSALDASAAEQLLAYIRKARDKGIAILFISHRMDEIFGHTDEIVVMRDGKVVGSGPTADFTAPALIEMMGMVETPIAHQAAAKAAGEAAVRVSEGGLQARAGEVVGLAGLAGHGQRELLLSVFDKLSARRRGGGDTVAFVAGDRQTEGLFPLWSVARNISTGVKSIARRGVINLRREAGIAEEWRQRFSIRVADLEDPVTGLSGGNQQKVIVARAFAHAADVVLLDDPLRGVDVGTKRELYRIVRDAADSGRTFLWYTTEIAELENCDVVYVFYRGAIAAVIPRAELTEQRVIEASFGREADNAT